MLFYIYSLLTLAPFLSPSVLTPNNRLKRKYDISNSTNMSGRAPTAPRTCPTSLSARQSVGSIFVPTPANKSEGNNDSETYFS